uniref:NPH3 domain-containing protein n=1 Tax=Oryza glumipatula TaxID=40148 RepID=A0A0E0ATY1_9ORYZ
MVGANTSLLLELESMVARRLDQATLGVVMIPCTALLDVPLVMCLVRGFLKDATRMARLVDAYLVESALEARLRPAEFEESSPAPYGLKYYDLVEGKGPTAVKDSIVQVKYHIKQVEKFVSYSVM